MYCFELPAIVFEHGRVDAVVVDRRRALDAQVQLHGAAADDFARGRFDFRLERGVAFAGAVAELEVPAVDRADFDRDGQSVRLAAGLAKAGHADEQG